MKIAVIGAGGIGSHLIHLLANVVNKDDSIIVFDGDSFEERNLSRQLFDENMIGLNKAESMAIMHEYLCDIDSIGKMIESADELAEFDLVFCVPDNNQCRRIAMDSADKSGQMLIVAGNESTSANALIHHPRSTGHSDDLHPLAVHPEYLQDTPSGNSCSARIREEPQTIIANAIAATMCMALYTAWVFSECSNVGDEARYKFMPIEFEWGKTFYKKHTAEDRLGIDFLTCQKTKEGE